MPFFKIIMPNYNNSEWLEKSVGSVLQQTFTDYHFIFVDDLSTDDSLEKFGDITGNKRRELTPRISWCQNTHKRWNGGSRNAGLKYGYPLIDSRYTLFLDSDDWFISDDILQKLHDFIIDADKPDCVRLPYTAEYNGNEHLPVMLSDSSPEMLVKSIFVACWTKCIKSELIQPFPENTLMEDVVQHIDQCDKINTVEVFTEPAVMYNRNNSNSCSAVHNQDLQHGKWQSSMFRYMADLLDLELTHDYCIEQRNWRADVCLNNIKKGVYTQSVD